jgi:hypothetical protein
MRGAVNVRFKVTHDEGEEVSNGEGGKGSGWTGM